MVKHFQVISASIVVLVAAATARAAPVPLALEPCGRLEVAGVVAGDRLVSSEGQHIALASVKAPELWRESDPYGSWPHAEKSRKALVDRVEGQIVHLFCGTESKSFDGELIAHAVTADGHWLQHALVESGMVFVFPRGGQKEGIESLYAAELAARFSQRGLWAELDLLAEADDDIDTGRVKIVSGRVISAARAGDRLYLNFGENWRRDFTAEISPRALRHFRKAGIDPLSLQSARVEVRGWVTWKGGPHIMLEGPEQLRQLHQ